MARKTRGRNWLEAYENRFDIMGKAKIWFLISAIVIGLGLFSIFTRGFNFGIDFTGGTIIDLKFNQAVTLQDIRTSLDKYGLSNATIQLSGDASNIESSENVMIRTLDLEETERKTIMASLASDVGEYTVLREEKVGAVIGDELIEDAILATIWSWIAIIIYVSFRFEWRFGVAAVLGLVHNVIIVLAVFSFTQKQVDSSFVAALLTVIGYSINDTIVIFDRIRENLRLHFRRGTDVSKLANASIYQSLTRSIYTVVTCVFTTVALYWFGGDTTKDFAFALMVGFTVGCYTSIFIASPLWVALKKRDTKPKTEDSAGEGEAEAKVDLAKAQQVEVKLLV